MEPKRVFTDEELRVAGLRSVDALAEALKAGDPAAALGFARRLKGEVRSMLEHELPALWELHKLHHSDENLNVTTIFRSHFFELAGQALVRGMTVGLLFDLTGSPRTSLAVVVVGLLPLVWDIFIHANVRIDGLRHLPPFLSTPQFHWIHHSRLPQHQDKNYAIWLPVFDVVFGSYYRPRVGEYPPTGLSSGEEIESIWEAQAGPLKAWYRMLRGERGSAILD